MFLLLLLMRLSLFGFVLIGSVRALWRFLFAICFVNRWVNHCMGEWICVVFVSVIGILLFLLRGVLEDFSRGDCMFDCYIVCLTVILYV